MPYEWVIPAAGAALEHRNELASLWKRIGSRLLGKKSRLVFTGMAGSGKTVLLDHLSGAAFTKDYTPPLQSEYVENRRLTAPGKRMAVAVIPGQPSRPRFAATEELFESDDPVDGVVHVVAYGFTEMRNEPARQVLVNDLGIATIEQFRNHQRLAELDDLVATCETIRSSFHRHSRPHWMLVAATKADLFAEEFGSARDYYSLGGGSDFSARLANLQSQLGSDNFRWSVLPVCSWLEDFNWNGEIRKSQLTLAQRNALLAQFGRQLEAYCEG